MPVGNNNSTENTVEKRTNRPRSQTINGFLSTLRPTQNVGGSSERKKLQPKPKQGLGSKSAPIHPGIQFDASASSLDAPISDNSFAVSVDNDDDLKKPLLGPQKKNKKNYLPHLKTTTQVALGLSYATIFGFHADPTGYAAQVLHNTEAGYILFPAISILNLITLATSAVELYKQENRTPRQIAEWILHLITFLATNIGLIGLFAAPHIFGAITPWIFIASLALDTCISLLKLGKATYELYNSSYVDQTRRRAVIFSLVETLMLGIATTVVLMGMGLHMQGAHTAALSVIGIICIFATMAVEIKKNQLAMQELADMSFQDTHQKLEMTTL